MSKYGEHGMNKQEVKLSLKQYTIIILNHITVLGTNCLYAFRTIQPLRYVINTPIYMLKDSEKFEQKQDIVKRHQKPLNK